ncbi:GSCFA domain-containing protein, partial [Salmonella enterica subsp. enterica]|nr:GSCFA domain-containing protein [Salmonella enterica subsp. enterica serovar Paratyphi A]
MAGASNPYNGLPDHCFWSRSHRAPMNEVDPVVKGGFALTPDMKIATAGSCFAQHIARHLKAAGYNYFVAEDAHPILNRAVVEAFNYGVFSARYGNIYTTRQLIQLVKRATGAFEPRENVWKLDNGNLVDPFRPNIQPNGYSRTDDFLRDRDRHFKAVRRILKESDVFVFTLGLTEAWRSKEDGAVFPLAPGVSGGKFDARRHEFVNFTVDDVVKDFE